MASILPLPPAVVGEFVGRSHVDLTRVTELLNAYPTLLHASFDWGNGDFETALHAAAHSGRRDIVDFLVNRGARIDIFAAAFLGKLPILKALLHDTPDALHRTGPHGIPLLEIAKKGNNRETIQYLNALLSPPKPKAKVKTAPSKSARPAKSAKPKRRKAA
jgi:ankyrin repeat protein